MPSKLSYETVKKTIEKEGDELLSNEYINNKKYLKIKCGRCSGEYEQKYDNFKRGYKHARCPEKIINRTGYNKKYIIEHGKKCILCEIFFIPSTKTQKFCSVGCSNKNKKVLVIKKCAFCKCDFQPRRSVQILCDEDCRKNYEKEKAKNDYFAKIGRKGGLISAKIQVRRSANEIHFADLCKEKFHNVLTNKNMFEGWDADIILPDLKIAISWNGAWHYKKIRENHNLDQVQNRDKIKNAIIKKHNYTHYIIKDMGSKSKKFVEEQFEKFCDSLS